jgi:CBS domain-containing protein
MVCDIMSESVVTASLDERIVSVAKKMSENHVSCVVVADSGKLAGILTQKDILRVVACEEGDYDRAKTSEEMSRPVRVVLPTLSVIAAGRIMEANGIKRLPVFEGKRLVGIVTQTDVTRGLTFLSPLRSVADIMSTDVATVRTDATVVEAARIMSHHNISCILTMDQEEVAGILTEKDLLDRVVIPRKHPRKTNVNEVMSRPVTWIPPSYSVLGAAQKMDQMHLHRLVVMDRKHLCGIVTQTDIMRAIRRELERADARCGPGTQDLPSDLRDLARVWHRVPEQVRTTIRTFVGNLTGDRSDPTERVERGPIRDRG